MSVGRRPAVGPLREAVTQALPNSWPTGNGDTAEVFPSSPAPGNPQRWYWRVVAPNGRIIASSGQGFTRCRSARRALARAFPPPAVGGVR